MLIQKLRGQGAALPARPPLRAIALAWLGGALAIATVFLWIFVNRTKTGRAMVATSQDPDTARLMGINVDRVIMAAFAVGERAFLQQRLCQT